MNMLSVIIPAYNAEKYLREAVKSAAAQCPELEKEIIIIDDGSDDATQKIARELADKLIQTDRVGAACARNAGLSAAAGNIIVLLDADDVLLDGSIAAMYAVICGGAEAVFSRAEDFISDELTEEEKSRLSPRAGSYAGVLPGCSMIRKEVFDKIGLFDTSLKSGETVAWMMKLRESAIPTVQLDTVTLKRRLHMTNTGRLSKNQEMKNYAKLLRERMLKK